MNATPTTSPTAPSAGAVRAALALASPTVRHCYGLTDPQFFRQREAATKEIYDAAAIIDRETRAKELEQDHARLDWLSDLFNYSRISTGPNGFLSAQKQAYCWNEHATLREAIDAAKIAKEGRA